MTGTADIVKEKLDITEIVRAYLTLSPAGKNLKGLCPFHKEKTPSFIVSPDRQSWHCFGCGEGGDMISFVMKYENIEFLDALKMLAEKAGVDVRKTAGGDERRHRVLYDINEAAKKFFVVQLESETNPSNRVNKYLIKRGLKSETIQEFELGYAPISSDGLSTFLLKQGFTISDIERAGLVLKTERGTYWDRFRNRIMFPLHNHFGKVIGFTGRIMPEAEDQKTGKYINSPESSIFNKSKLLFGLYKTKPAIRELKTAVFVEGQMDFLLAWQDGVKNIVATSGTAVTLEHLKTVKRIADTIVIAFDNDEAGYVASERMIDLAQAEDFSVKLIANIDKTVKDPADIVTITPGKLRIFIQDAEPAMQYYFRRYVSENKNDIEVMKRGLRIVLGKIHGIKSSVERAHWIRELSHRTNIREEHLFDDMNSLKQAITVLRPKSSEQNQEGARELTRHERISERLVILAAADTYAEAEVSKHIKFLTEAYKTVFSMLTQSVSDSNVSQELKQLAHTLQLKSSLETRTVEAVYEEVHELIRQVKIEYLKVNQQKLGERIRQAEAIGDTGELQKALHEFDQISQELYNV
jgi:DNA primase